MRFCTLAILAIVLFINTPTTFADRSAPMPPGMTVESVKTNQARYCSQDSNSENCRRFSRILHCRAVFNLEKCLPERKHYYCNVDVDQTECTRLTRVLAGNGSSGSGSSGSSSGADIDDTDNGPVDSDHGGSVPLCQLTGTCGGTSSGSGSGSGSSGSSSGMASSSGSTGSSGGGSSSGSITPPKLCIPSSGCNQDVTPGNFQSALNGANCGCSLTLGAGNYPAFNYTKNCPASNPIVLRASGSGVKFGSFTINGTGLTVSGPEITGQVWFNGDYNRITRAAFTGNAEIDFKEGSQNNRIDHNDFVLNRMGVGETQTAIGFYRPRSAAQMYANNRIDSNYFTTNTSTPSADVGGNGIFLCMYGAQDGYQYAKQFGSAKTLIENNLFENWGRKNVMEVKCSDNVFRNNTLVNTGRVLNRHGGRNTYENNWFQNLTTGLAIREYDNKVTGNYFEAARIILYKGTRNYPEGECFQHRDWMPAGYQAPQGPPAVRTLLDNNSGPLIIGDKEGSGCEVPVLQTQIRSHKGPISKISEVGTSGPTSTNASPPARKLTRSQVGRGAAEPGCN